MPAPADLLRLLVTFFDFHGPRKLTGFLIAQAPPFGIRVKRAKDAR